MRELILPESGPKMKLLNAAEQLFAEKGFESVSVRDVTQFVKMNVAAVNYHFGSRDGMLTLVMLRYANPVNEERLARLDATERKWAGKGLPLEEIMDAFVRPLLSQARRSDLSERLLYQLLGRIFAQYGQNMPSSIAQNFQQVNDRFVRAFAKALPTLAADDLAARIHLMHGGVIHLLTHYGMLGAAPDGLPSMEATLGRLVRFGTAGLREGTEGEAAVKKGPQAMFDF